MVYVIGDLHGNFSNLIDFSHSEEGKLLTKKDYVIVLGDFGIWPEKIEEIKQLNSKLNFTLLFIEGNHENYQLLESFHTQQMFGGMVRNIYGIYHLCRSEIYLIPNGEKVLTIAVCGGGDSRDKDKRIVGISWFKKEKISDNDVKRLLYNAEKINMRVDYFLSHSLSATVKAELYYEYLICPLCKISDYKITESDYKIRDIIGELNANVYISAHEHIDRNFLLSGKRYQSVYKKFVKLEN